KVIAVGYKGGIPTSGDDAALARFDVGFVPGPNAAIAGVEPNAQLKKGPSTLAGTVTPAAGATRVMLKLTRGSGTSCRSFNLAKQSFSGLNCTTYKGFAAVLDKGKWTAYLGPALPKGSYAIEAFAVTANGRKKAVTAGA